MKLKTTQIIKAKACKECKKPILGFGKTGLCRSCGHKGERAYNFKGENASHASIHAWLYSQVGKASYCSFNSRHKSTRYHWASISHGFKRDIVDYISLCPSCHIKYDFTEQTKMKMSKSKMGVKLTEEHKRNMSLGQFRRWRTIGKYAKS